MSLATIAAFIVTVFASVSFVTVLILLGWYLIWKAFLSKFRLVRELLGQIDDKENTQDASTQQADQTQKIRQD